MWFQRRQHERIQKSPEQRVHNAVEFETRFDKRLKRFLQVFFVAQMAAYPVREELYAVGNRSLREASGWLEGKDGEAHAKAVMEQFKDELEKGEPIPVDLLVFYLEQERQSAGVSDEVIAQAKVRFEEIMATAMEMREAGASRSDVLGYVLKQQGSYDTSSSLLADLLVTGRGECEARQRYISAAYQRLYPEDVADGKMKIESFRPFVDDKGALHPGHVRVVIDEGERVSVLEGDAVNSEPAEEHEDIGAMEATQLAVKGYAAKEGIYSIDNDKVIDELDVLSEVKRGLTGGHVLENVGEGIRDFAEDNSVSAYPASNATYLGGTGQQDVDPHPVGGSWGASQLNWKGAIELTLIEKPREMTMADIDASVVYRGSTRALDFSTYASVPAEVLAATLAHHPLEAIIVRPDQQLPVEPLKNRMNWFIIDAPKKLPEFLSNVPVRVLFLMDVEEMPEGLEHVQWEDGAQLSLHPRDGVAAFETHGRHFALRNSKVRSIDIDATTSLDGTMLKTTIDVPPAPIGELDGFHLESMDIERVDVIRFGELDVKKLQYFPVHAPAVGSLMSIHAERVTLMVPPGNTVDSTPFMIPEFTSPPGRAASVRTLELYGKTYGPDAFKGLQLGAVVSHVEKWQPLSLQGASIERLFIMEAPFGVDGMSDAGDPEVQQMFEGDVHVGIVIFAPTGRTHGPDGHPSLEDYDAYQRSGTGKGDPGMTLLDQARFMRNIIPNTIPIVCMTPDDLYALVTKYDGYHNIPLAALLKADYLQGAANK